MIDGEQALLGDGFHFGVLRDYFQRMEIQKSDQGTGRSLALMAFTNRSGSNYIGDILAQTRHFYGFREDLNHDVVTNRCSQTGFTEFADYVRYIADLQQKPEAIFGLKASADQIKMLRTCGADGMFQSLTVLRVLRRDRVAQAVSLWFATKTQQWSSRHEAQEIEIRYDFNELKSVLSGVQRSENAMDLILSVLRYPIFEVFYEDILDDEQTEIDRVFECFDLATTENTVRKSRFLRQVSAEKSEMVEKFRTDLGRSWDVEPVQK